MKRKKRKSGTQMAIEVLDKMLAMSNEELDALLKKHENEPEHWSTPILRDLGYFERIAAEHNERKKK